MLASLVSVIRMGSSCDFQRCGVSLWDIKDDINTHQRHGPLAFLSLPCGQVTSWSLNLGNLVPTASYWHRQLTSERTMPQCIQYTTWEQLERKVCSIDRCWKGVPSIRFLGGSCQDWPITVSWMQVQQSRHAVDVDETQATIWRLWWG